MTAVENVYYVIRTDKKSGEAREVCWHDDRDWARIHTRVMNDVFGNIAKFHVKRKFIPMRLAFPAR